MMDIVRIILIENCIKKLKKKKKSDDFHLTFDLCYEKNI